MTGVLLSSWERMSPFPHVLLHAQFPFASPWWGMRGGERIGRRMGYKLVTFWGTFWSRVWSFYSNNAQNYRIFSLHGLLSLPVCLSSVTLLCDHHQKHFSLPSDHCWVSCDSVIYWALGECMMLEGGSEEKGELPRAGVSKIPSCSTNRKVASSKAISSKMWFYHRSLGFWIWAPKMRNSPWNGKQLKVVYLV